VAVEVGEGFGVVGDHGVEVESLRVGEIGVGDGNGDGGPVGAEPAAEAAGVIAGAEVVVAGFGVAFFAFEFVVLRAGVGVGVLAAVGIEIGVIADCAAVLGDDARRAEKVFGVVDRCSSTRGSEADRAVVEAGSQRGEWRELMMPPQEMMWKLLRRSRSRGK
jgi:hypothetical protein